MEGQKVALLAVGIINGYLGIRLRQSDLIIAAFCTVVYVTTIVCYCGTFSRAYRVHELQKDVKRELRAACGKLSPRADYKARREGFMAAVNALSCPGLRVVRFHEMERQSALIFIDFLGTQIISLLVAF